MDSNEVEWRYGNADFKRSTFFPYHWTPAQVLMTIGEALHNNPKVKHIAGKNMITGRSSQGIKIITILEVDTVKLQEKLLLLILHLLLNNKEML